MAYIFYDMQLCFSEVSEVSEIEEFLDLRIYEDRSNLLACLLTCLLRFQFCLSACHLACLPANLVLGVVEHAARPPRSWIGLAAHLSRGGEAGQRTFRAAG